MMLARLLMGARHSSSFLPPPGSQARTCCRGLATLTLLGADIPGSVKIVEVSTAVKVELIRRLAQAGLQNIEATSFVSPKWIPQMADHSEVLSGAQAALAVARSPAILSVLTPNLKGFSAAVEAGATEVAVFTAASEGFARQNLNCSIEESFGRFTPLVEEAKRRGVRVRGYVSCVAGCPYDGRVSPKDVATVAARLHEMGCAEVSLGDTLGVGTPASIERVLRAVLREVPREAVAVHFHDTYGMAVANILTSLQMGVGIVDTAVGGLGGCPYARGATGNVATEDVVYLLDGLGVRTGVDLDGVLEAADFILGELGRAGQSRLGAARASARGGGGGGG